MSFKRRKTYNRWMHSTRIPLAILIMALIVVCGLGYAFGQANQKGKEVDYFKNKLEQTEKELKEVRNKEEEKEKEIEKLKKISELPIQQKMAIKVKQFFPKSYKTALMIFKSESGLIPDKKGYNCYYGDISKACAVADRYRAWSVDCGIAQLNFLGKECPPQAFDPDWNLAQAAAKYERRGWQPWVVFNRGIYQQNEAWAQETISKIAFVNEK